MFTALTEVKRQTSAKLSTIGNINRLKKAVKKYQLMEKQQLKSINTLNKRIKGKNTELKRLRLKCTYIESCLNKKKNRLEQAKQTIVELEDQLERKQHELNNETITREGIERQMREHEAENDYLRDIINDNVNTYDDDKKVFTPELQQCVYELLNSNVSFQQVSPVIESVLNMVKIKANRLPSKSTVNNMSIQRLFLSQKHIGEKLTPKPNICVLSDETNKFGSKYEGIHATDEDGNYWVLGVREISTKAGKDVLQTLLTILGDIDSVSETADNQASREILKHISSTMSDRASTQIKFNQLLEEFRKEVLKEDLGEQWDTMTNEEQLSISRLCNFFCSLHALVHMAETCSKSLVEYEKNIDAPILDISFKKETESGTVRLIRTTCKSFSKGGDEKNGQFLNFETYAKDFLKENGFRGVPLERFRGNRFNILFRNAAYVYFLKDQLQGYLRIESSNRLLAAVKHDISIPEYLAGCKALGLISELITVPLWCMIEDENVHIIEARTHYEELVQYLENFPQHVQEFMECSYFLSFVNREKIFTSKIAMALFNEWDHDGIVVTILMVLMPALCELCKRLFKDFLPGGTWCDATESVQERTLGVPKHNKFSETIFGHMDRLLREKPNISQLASEANMMFIHNKTIEWLKQKSSLEKEAIVIAARRDVQSLRLKYKQRRDQVEIERKRLLAEKREQAERSEANRIRKKENITDKVQLWGLWQTEEEVDSGLDLLKTKVDKITALKAQLHFRKTVLDQKCSDKTAFKMSKTVDGKNVSLTVDELSQNVKKLVRKAYEIDINENPENQVLVGKKVKHAFEQKDQPDEKVWYIGKVISQVNVVCGLHLDYTKPYCDFKDSFHA
ncbi:uncharacterized protein LOC128554835 [Mercenaria mercenaria]|uniref:uncharacterized protein LOC128554835 n=1 Tax=Mercenaria mercenaria TaxID=6596 RepID=UPI00234F3906|nr:uncharacterized protein LOC128554835 [Mercenaria mercenaria]